MSVPGSMVGGSSFRVRMGRHDRLRMGLSESEPAPRPQAPAASVRAGARRGQASRSRGERRPARCSRHAGRERRGRGRSRLPALVSEAGVDDAPVLGARRANNQTPRSASRSTRRVTPLLLSRSDALTSAMRRRCSGASLRSTSRSASSGRRPSSTSSTSASLVLREPARARERRPEIEGDALALQLLRRCSSALPCRPSTHVSYEIVSDTNYCTCKYFGGYREHRDHRSRERGQGAHRIGHQGWTQRHRKLERRRVGACTRRSDRRTSGRVRPRGCRGGRRGRPRDPLRRRGRSAGRDERGARRQGTRRRDQPGQRRLLGTRHERHLGRRGVSRARRRARAS